MFAHCNSPLYGTRAITGSGNRLGFLLLAYCHRHGKFPFAISHSKCFYTAVPVCHRQGPHGK